MMLRVQYKDYRHDYVDTRTLDRLIERKELRWFYRPSEKSWVNVYRDSIRGLGGDYSGPNRRQPNMAA